MFLKIFHGDFIFIYLFIFCLDVWLEVVVSALMLSSGGALMNSFLLSLAGDQSTPVSVSDSKCVAVFIYVFLLSPD